MKRYISTIVLLLLILGVFYSHHLYERSVIDKPDEKRVMPAEVIKMFDLGLHSALASFFWVDTRLHLPFLQDGFDRFWSDLNRVIVMDPKFPTPYVHTLLLLPESDFEDKVQATISVGKYGVENSYDWRIPFHLGAIFHLYEQNREEAAIYFDIASRMDGIPETVRQYSLNYGLLPTVRQQSQGIWQAIYETSADEQVRSRALMHIDHLEAAGVIENAIDIYFQQFGHYPNSIEDILVSEILLEIPESPFGVIWRMYPNGILGVDHQNL